MQHSAMVHIQHQKSGQKCSIYKKKPSEDTEEKILGVIPRDKRKIHSKEEKSFSAKQSRKFKIPLTHTFRVFLSHLAPLSTGEVLCVKSQLSLLLKYKISGLVRPENNFQCEENWRKSVMRTCCCFIQGNS